MTPARVLILVLAILATSGAARAQDFTQRGFAEVSTILYPQVVPGDSTRVVADALLRYEVRFRVAPWLRVAGGLDARMDTHDQVERRWTVDWSDRGIRRPPIAVRKLSVSATRGPFSLEVGKQFVRWGKADVLNPTDRFAPRDYLTVVDSTFLAVTAARGIYEGKADTLDAVWVPRLTPSRIPLFDQRWSPIPGSVRQALQIIDGGAVYPEGGQFGVRWNHLGSGYEFSLSFYDGFNHLPLIQALPPTDPRERELVRTYPQMRMHGGDAAVPLRWFTLKGEVGYFTSRTPEAEEYGIYVVQLERQVGEWQIVGGYAGDFVTRTGSGQLFAPDLGLTHAFLGRVGYTIDATRNFVLEAAVRETGAGGWLKAEYSQAIGKHWRATLEGNLIRGDADDFIGQYARNSNVNLAVRCSF